MNTATSGFYCSLILTPEQVPNADVYQTLFLRGIGEPFRSLGCMATDDIIHSECGYREPWLGACTNTKPCMTHSMLTCSSCGKRATQSCGETGMFVCGAPLCDNCEHFIFADGTNGGVGFGEAACAKRHLPKKEQVNLPWYRRETSK